MTSETKTTADAGVLTKAATPTPAAPIKKPCPKFITGEDGVSRLKDPDAPRLTYREIFGVPDVDTATAEYHRLRVALAMLETQSKEADLANVYLPMIASIGPRDAVEMALATQFAVTHAVTMHFMALGAGLAKTGPLMADRFFNMLTKLQRTQIALADALARGRGKATSQTIRIERVDVADGGQVAITGKLEGGAGRGMKSENAIAPHERRAGGRLKNDNPPFDLSRVRRCGARRKRDGKPCRCPAMKNGRCARHGGKSTGPRTPEGRSRAALANFRHGYYTRDAIEERRQIRALIGANLSTLTRAR